MQLSKNNTKKYWRVLIRLVHYGSMKLLPNIPAYLQIKDYYKNLIEKGALKEGDYLPSVRDTSLLIGVNPNTVQRAFSLLIEMGYLTPISGKGNRINKVDNPDNDDELYQLIQDIKFKGYSLKEIQEKVQIMIEKGENENDSNK